jgi:hypothetical protein
MAKGGGGGVHWWRSNVPAVPIDKWINIKPESFMTSRKTQNKESEGERVAVGGWPRMRRAWQPWRLPVATTGRPAVPGSNGQHVQAREERQVKETLQAQGTGRGRSSCGQFGWHVEMTGGRTKKEKESMVAVVLRLRRRG